MKLFLVALIVFLAFGFVAAPTAFAGDDCDDNGGCDDCGGCGGGGNHKADGGNGDDHDDDHGDCGGGCGGH